MQSSEQTANELGRLLAGAQGYTVYTHGGVLLGALERVRYETQVSRPDEIVVRGRGLFRRRRSIFPFGSIYAVSPHEGRVALRPDAARTEGRRAARPHRERRMHNSTACVQGRSTAAKEELAWPSDTNCATRTAPTKARS